MLPTVHVAKMLKSEYLKSMVKCTMPIQSYPKKSFVQDVRFFSIPPRLSLFHLIFPIFH